MTTSHLQWTMVGPVLWSSNERTRRRKARRGYVEVGSPLSGHDVNWKRVIVRLSPCQREHYKVNITISRFFMDLFHKVNIKVVVLHIGC